MKKSRLTLVNVLCRKICVLLCATAIALPPPAWGMMRGRRVDHEFDASAVYSFQAVVCTERDGTLTKPPQPPTRARGQACQTYTSQAQPIRESFEGEDKRIRVEKPDGWPYSVHAQMESYALDGRPFSGSGVLVGPHHLLTAAHCVYDSRKMDGWAQSLTIYPGLNDASAPFGEVKGVKAYLYQEWVEGENPDFDLALVILDKAVGEETGWAGMLALKEDALRELKVHVTGYPGDPSKRNQLWTMEDALDHVDPEQFAYKMHTSGGQSGGGIWINQWESPFVVGIHTMGYVGRNFGVRLSKQKLQDIIGWMEETGKRRGTGVFPLNANTGSVSSASSSSSVDPLTIRLSPHRSASQDASFDASEIARLWEKMKDKWDGGLYVERMALQPTMAECAGNLEFPYQWDAITRLLNWEERNIQDWQESQQRNFLAARQGLLKIARSTEHPKQMEAIDILWGWGDQPRVRNSPYRTSDRAEFRSFFLEIACNIHHPRNFAMIEKLWQSNDEQQTLNRTDLMPILFKIAQDTTHQKQFEAITMLWKAEEQNWVLLNPILLRMAQNFEHPKQFEAIELLLRRRFSRRSPLSPSEEARIQENHMILDPILLEIAKDKEKLHRKNVFDYLNLSPDQDTREAARILLITIVKDFTKSDPSKSHLSLDDWCAHVKELWSEDNDKIRKKNRLALRSMLQKIYKGTSFSYHDERGVRKGSHSPHMYDCAKYHLANERLGKSDCILL